MADAKALFLAEFGSYFDTVSATNPVGVCSKCLALRTRNEVDPQEKCPADLVRHGLENVMKAEPHEWKGFTERAPLEAFVKTNIPVYQDLCKQAAALITILPAAGE